jgi:hypothetical protein
MRNAETAGLVDESSAIRLEHQVMNAAQTEANARNFDTGARKNCPLHHWQALPAFAKSARSNQALKPMARRSDLLVAGGGTAR